MKASIVLLLATPALCRVPLAARQDEITDWQQPEEPHPPQQSSGTLPKRVAATQSARGKRGGGWAFPDDKRLPKDKANGQREPSPKPKPKPNPESEPSSESETTAAAGPKPAQEEGWTFPENSRPSGGKPNSQGKPNSDPQPTSDSRQHSEPEPGSESKSEAAPNPQAPPSENKAPAAAPEKKLLPWIPYTGWKPICGMPGLKVERLCGSRPYCASFKSPYVEKMHEPLYASEAECLAAREKSSDVKMEAPRRKPWIEGGVTLQRRPECETLPVNEKKCGTAHFCNAHGKKEGAGKRDYASAQECFNDHQLPKSAQKIEEEDGGR